MPGSRILISSQTLSSSTASITFNSIPSIYKDLILRASVRTTASGAFSNLELVLNSNTGAVYSYTRLLGYGSGTSSDRSSSTNAGNISYANGDTSTANIFSSLEVYIPSYTASQNKPISSITMQENNQATAYIYPTAQLFSSTTTISSIQINEGSGNNLITNSTFYLYGLKAS